ncbi:MAG: geranylgeranyl reductase family protein [Actinomycetota bacterium]|nr:geranylgeranyl reductase family protein [Actinomycetota bacterium]
MPALPTETDVLVIGAGPAGAAAAAWASRGGLDVVLADAQVFPRDKTCGDGLTPRAIHELTSLGLGEWLQGQPRNLGLRAAGFGQTLMLPWPGGSLPNYGSAVPRTELDARIREVALSAGAIPLDGHRAVDVEFDRGRVAAVTFTCVVEGKKVNRVVRCKRLVVADGAKSQLGRRLGREWHKDTAYGVAGRAYIRSGRSDDKWISSHLELRGEHNEVLSGYGWIFPLGDGEVNIGVGTLATTKRPADVNLRALTELYTDQQRAQWALDGELQLFSSALLPMGGAVSNIAGSNWMLIGDAAGCVNPLNGEGIDYGLETGNLAAHILIDTKDSSAVDYSLVWPGELSIRYGTAFSIARRLAGLLTVPGFIKTMGPVGMRSAALMTIALRVMGNLVTEEDRDATARVWRTAGRASMKLDDRPPFS